MGGRCGLQVAGAGGEWQAVRVRERVCAWVSRASASEHARVSWRRHLQREQRREEHLRRRDAEHDGGRPSPGARVGLEVERLDPQLRPRDEEGRVRPRATRRQRQVVEPAAAAETARTGRGGVTRRARRRMWCGASGPEGGRRGAPERYHEHVAARADQVEWRVVAAQPRPEVVQPVDGEDAREPERTSHRAERVRERQQERHLHRRAPADR